MRDLKIPGERHPEKAHRPDQEQPRKPAWILVKAPTSPGYRETARIMLEQLGIARLQVLGESEPGVVLLRSMTDRPQCIATKAGAFGDAGSLERARQALRSRLACDAPAPS